jgi:flagellar biosynthesis/type III secretory pathway chaperone
MVGTGSGIAGACASDCRLSAFFGMGSVAQQKDDAPPGRPKMSAAQSVLAPLTDVLNREEEACDRLLSTLHQERTAIRRLMIDEFETINKDRGSILGSLERLETERRHAMGELSRFWNLPEETLTLQRIVERLKSSGTTGLDERYARLAKKLRAVREEIAFNAKLIEAIQSFVTKVLSAWSEGEPADGIYSFSGDRGFRASGGALLRQRG